MNTSLHQYTTASHDDLDHFSLSLSLSFSLSLSLSLPLFLPLSFYLFVCSVSASEFHNVSISLVHSNSQQLIYIEVKRGLIDVVRGCSSRSLNHSLETIIGRPFVGDSQPPGKTIRLLQFGNY